MLLKQFIYIIFSLKINFKMKQPQDDYRKTQGEKIDSLLGANDKSKSFMHDAEAGTKPWFGDSRTAFRCLPIRNAI